MTESVLIEIRRLLTQAGAPFTEKQHPPTYTSEESAAARGEPLGAGAKALLLVGDDVFRLFVLPADRKLDSAAVKHELHVNKLRFATPEELYELTGLVPGAVPPFGRPILPLDLYADSAVGAAYEQIAFNAGALTVSIIMSAAAWDAIARPKRFRFAQAIPPH